MRLWAFTVALRSCDLLARKNTLVHWIQLESIFFYSRAQTHTNKSTWFLLYRRESFTPLHPLHCIENETQAGMWNTEFVVGKHFPCIVFFHDSLVESSRVRSFVRGNTLEFQFVERSYTLITSSFKQLHCSKHTPIAMLWIYTFILTL